MLRVSWTTAALAACLMILTACGDDDNGIHASDGAGLDAITDATVAQDVAVTADASADAGTGPECATADDCAWLDPSQCEVAVCDPQSETCVLEDLADDTPCHDGDGQTCYDTCQQGTCTAGVCGGAATIAGRVWDYFVNMGSLQYEYPSEQITVGAYVSAATPLAETLTDVNSCTPWNPGDPYMCGTFSLGLTAGWEVMLKATNHAGYWDTLTQIFTVADGDVHVVVMIDTTAVGFVASAWGVPIDPTQGHVVGVVATTTNDIGQAPFDQWIGDASVTISPSGQFGADHVLVYYDEAVPTNMARTTTDPNASIFVALNVPPRPYEDPYEITISHPTETFAPVRFAVEAGVLTYLILSPTASP